MTDSRGDVAYLMTDISDVTTSQIKDLHEQLTLLEREYITSTTTYVALIRYNPTNHSYLPACIKARILY